MWGLPYLTTLFLKKCNIYMSASYLHFVKQYQNRIGLSHKELNKLDRKYNDVNLIKKLQQLYSRAASTGFYGTFDISNIKIGELPISLQAKVAYNNVDITSYITIASGATSTITIPVGRRLPNPSSLLQLKLIFGAGVTSVDNQNITGFTPISATENDLTEENTIELLVDSGQINGGNLTLTINVA